MPSKIDLVGRIFGLVKVESPAPSSSGKTYWNCSCIKCDATKVIQGSHLTAGATQTCGCGCQLNKGNNTEEERICGICGKKFQLINNSWNRKYCYDCVPNNCTEAQKVTIKRRAIKEALVAYKGGKCERCGYNKCMRALEFHHTNSKEKDFGISFNLSRTIEDLKKEVDKCILLCSNCHAEVHQELYEQGLISEAE